MRPILAKLVNPNSTLPMPDRNFRPFRANGETVDADNPFWAGCLADKSIVEVALTPVPESPPAASVAEPTKTKRG